MHRIIDRITNNIHLVCGCGKKIHSVKGIFAHFYHDPPKKAIRLLVRSRIVIGNYKERKND